MALGRGPYGTCSDQTAAGKLTNVIAKLWRILWNMVVAPKDRVIIGKLR